MNSDQNNSKDDQTNGTFQRLNSTGTSNTSEDNKNGAAINPEKSIHVQTEVEPDCRKCGDSLWVLTASEEDDESRMVVPCDCQIDVAGRRDRLRTYAQLGFLERMNFGTLRRNFRGVDDVAAFLKAKDVSRDFADDPKGWLVFEGASGSGKTHFAVAIVNALIRRGAPAKYVSALDIPDLIRSGWSQGSEDFESDGYTPLLDAPMLVIDDFGVQPSAEWVDAKIDQLLTLRYNGRAPTVVGLAKPLGDLPERHSTKLSDPTLTRVIKLTRVESDRAGLTESMLKEMSFETFKTEKVPGTNQQQQDYLSLALGTAKDFVKPDGQSSPWLYIRGDTGVGKTHIAVAIAKASISDGISVAYWSVPDFLDRLRQTYSTRDQTAFSSLFDTVRNAELLILDDFGLQQLTDWSVEKLYQLISYRHERRMRTVVAGHYEVSNHGRDESERNRDPRSNFAKDPMLTSSTNSDTYDERTRIMSSLQWKSIVSRLQDFQTATVVELPVPDYRASDTRNRGG